MAKRTIRIESPCRLHISSGALIVEPKSGRAASIALSEIWVVVVENQQTTLSAAFLAQAAKAGIGIMTCGEDHMPVALSLPLGAHSRHASIVENQLAIPKPLQKRLWQLTVQAKIDNQARLLELLGKDHAPLREYARKVKSGDPDNREAAAAKEYFSQLIEDGGRRGSAYTAALDYGYAVLRSGIARELVAGGWLVSRGIHHASAANAFNLADDLIEPFRPMADLIVFGQGVSGGLGSASKHVLASVFEKPVLMQGREMLLQSSIGEAVDTFKQAVTAMDYRLLAYPELIDFR